jgi:hypothetical protein
MDHLKVSSKNEGAERGDYIIKLPTGTILYLHSLKTFHRCPVCDILYRNITYSESEGELKNKHVYMVRCEHHMM